ncbi:MAG TPA: SIS domain-containing protein, partial [bacterium]|nr:SIS domain-containing protein [bacterium]HEX67840.1 SIS domain-containing protein [bacterium]
MKELIKRVVEESIKLRKWLWEESHTIIKISQEVLKTLQEGRKILLFGNGGSAADAQHIAAEMVGKFKCERNPFPAVALTTNTSILTSISNDYSFEEVFARQVTAVGESG